VSDLTQPYNRLIRTGDTKAFQQVFELLYTPLHAYAFSFVANSEVAEELVQESFLMIWYHRGKIDEEFNMKAYLYKSVHNQALNHLRHQKIVLKHKEQAHGSNSSYTEWHGEPNPFLSKALYEAIEQLPERSRLIFEMSRLDGLRHREIAEKLNISEKTVEVQVRKARLFLQKKLKRFYKEL
jgi:RNA polymerase sigma-70 factor (ECF subfamily)